MAADWRRDLAFADRLAATTKISTAYKACHTNCTGAEASKHAKANEQTARESAVSQREYHDLIAKTVHDLLSRRKTEPSLPAADASSVGVPQLTSDASSARTLGSYVIMRHHKDGLFSEVLQAISPASDERSSHNIVALKVTSPDVEGPPHDSKREVRLLNSAKSERVIKLIEAFHQAGGRFVLVFPFMQYDLDVLLHQQLLTEQSRRSILSDLFSALAHLHSLDIIHRDIKPSNILLASPSGPAYLSDFGIAWSPSDPGSEPADEKILDVGTTCYRPPELLFGNQQYGAKLDMWAAGCTVAQIACLNGRTLFEAGDLGSELALIRSMFETLGTPDLEVWPEASTFPDWGKMNFRQYPSNTWQEILPQADADALDLVSNLVVFESSRRLSAEAALQHPYLQ